MKYKLSEKIILVIGALSIIIGFLFGGWVALALGFGCIIIVALAKSSQKS